VHKTGHISVDLNKF